jgi:DNA-binding NtrC family response regulator
MYPRPNVDWRRIPRSPVCCSRPDRLRMKREAVDRAVRLIGHEPPDGVLLDVRLREGSAVEVAKALQKRGVPFVVMSGYSRDTLPSELRKAPFVAKPMSESELIDTARSTF